MPASYLFEKAAGQPVTLLRGDSSWSCVLNVPPFGRLTLTPAEGDSRATVMSRQLPIGDAVSLSWETGVVAHEVVVVVRGMDQSTVTLVVEPVGRVRSRRIASLRPNGNLPAAVAWISAGEFRTFQAKARNLSSTGVVLDARRNEILALPEGEHVAVTFSLPDGKRISAVCAVGDGATTATTSARLPFVQISESDRAAVAKAVRRELVSRKQWSS